ncbi:serine threonine kinase isoform A [Micractinium conductrix]|uniref:Serine threonine kinase isoform A n=1 Tax=Micractinium conductrix TaxID=554055 RepID=A0A2P6V8E0_9CHLO|nr:serine threonine kinase isoform A [Micractinium conductrix]|eukprot:PSC70354.1 serine threonine kinase isoform A [Micractinium conductrix]
MFGLVERSASRLFGATLVEPASQTIESVGALCELTHLVRVPERGLLLAAARVVGRFQAAQVLAAEPFVTVEGVDYADVHPAGEWDALSLAAQERRVWRRLLHIVALEERLEPVLSGELADRVEALTCSTEIVRWSPCSEARDAVPAAPTADAAALEQLAALSGGDPATLGQRTREHLCQDALRSVGEDGRRERFSFALASALATCTEWQQQQLCSQQQPGDAQDPPLAAGPSAAAAAAAEAEGGVGKWADAYAAAAAGSTEDAAAAPFLLPLMTLSKAKLPTESVPLQIFEPRYRLMFKLINQSKCRRFGVVLADRANGLMESVGALCELTHFVQVPERRRLFINARVVGRFQTEQLASDKPVVTVLAKHYGDHSPADLAGELQLGASEMRVWQTMQDVRQLASKLFVQGKEQLGHEIFSLEVRRWSPDAEARAGVPTAAGADPTLMQMVQMAGLLGEEETIPQRTTEYLCSDALRAVSEAERRERFSFALARTLDFTPHQMQDLLYCQDTGERLRAAEELILEGRNYLAARSTLRDMPRGIGEMGSAKRKSVQLTRQSSRDVVEAWIAQELPSDIAQKLISTWQEHGEVFDGDMLLGADEQLLIDTGAARTVARRLMAKVQQIGQSAGWLVLAQGEQPKRARRSQTPQLPAAQQEQQQEEEAQQEEQKVEEQAGEEEQPAEEEEEAAVADHAMPLSAPPAARGRRRSSRRLTPPAAEKAEEEQPRMLTRRQRQHLEQQQEQQAEAAAREQQQEQQAGEHEEQPAAVAPPAARRRGRQSRISAVHTQQAAAELRAGAWLAPGAEPRSPRQRPAAATQQQQQQLEEAEGPPVVEDLGPEAFQGQYKKDWKRECWKGLEEIFRDFMTVEQLTDLCNELAEDWDEAADKCLGEKRKVDGSKRWCPYRQPSPIVKKLVKLLRTGSLDRRAAEAGGTSQLGIVECLRGKHCDEPVERYVNERLRQRYPSLPPADDPHTLLWQLWEVPVGPAEPVEQAFLGSRRIPYLRIDGEGAGGLEPGGNSMVPWGGVYRAIQREDMVLEAPSHELTRSLTQMNYLSKNQNCSVTVCLNRTPSNRSLQVYLHLPFAVDRPGSAQLNGAFVAEEEVFDELGGYKDESLVAVDFAAVFAGLDEYRGTPFVEQLESLKAAHRATQAQVEAKGLPRVLDLHQPVLSKGQFDAVIKPLVQGVERSEPQGFKQRCDADFLLELTPAQRRTVAHMLQEETAEGGSSRHLCVTCRWVKLNLKNQPELHCYVLPVLSQIRCYTSRLEAQQGIHACGGAGWAALEVGMGKTACAVAITQLNPPPEGWCKKRAHQSLRRYDHLAAQQNNKQHAQTLVVAPPPIINQWKEEFRKTTAKQLRVLMWVDGSKKEPLCHDAAKLAAAHVVLVDTNTVRNASNLSTLCAMRWHRIIVDESQQAGSFLDAPITASHRWLLTGTPDNSNDLNTMGSQWGFIGLAPHNPIFSNFPGALAHVLKSAMVCYSRAGQLEGRRNLELPPLQETVIRCKLNEEDAAWYRSLQDKQRDAFLQLSGLSPHLRGREAQPAMPTSSPLVPSFMTPAGGYVPETRQYSSKVDAVIKELRRKGPGEKVVIFSEHPATLRAIKARLPELGLESRDLLGSSKCEKRGQEIADFQVAPPTQVFLLTHRTGGAGVTLTAGSHVILCEPLLNPTFEEQAIGRCYRMGQAQSVKVTRLVAEGTIEERIQDLMARVARGGAGGSEEGAALVDRSTRLSVDDVWDLLCEDETEGAETGC